jgi:hypothetical protein
VHFWDFSKALKGLLEAGIPLDELRRRLDNVDALRRSVTSSSSSHLAEEKSVTEGLGLLFSQYVAQAVAESGEGARNGIEIDGGP